MHTDKEISCFYETPEFITVELRPEPAEHSAINFQHLVFNYVHLLLFPRVQSPSFCVMLKCIKYALVLINKVTLEKHVTNCQEVHRS